jgi:hypothetical protein
MAILAAYGFLDRFSGRAALAFDVGAGDKNSAAPISIGQLGLEAARTAAPLALSRELALPEVIPSRNSRQLTRSMMRWRKSV